MRGIVLELTSVKVLCVVMSCRSCLICIPPLHTHNRPSTSPTRARKHAYTHTTRATGPQYKSTGLRRR